MKNNFLAILACFVFLLLALFSAEGFTWKNLRYSGNAITTDEMAHIPSGYYYLKTGKYFLNPEHPPLVKDVSALSLIFLNPVFPEIDKQEDIQEWFAWYGYPPAEFIFSNNLEIKNAQWDFSGIFLFNPKNDPDKIAFFARLSVILFNSILLFLLYRSVLLLWGNRAAILALALIVFSQFNIAHGSLVTMDFMSSILQMLAVATFSIYIKRLTEDKNSIFFFILTLGYLSLALLAKFSSLILIPFLFLGGIVFILMRKKLRFLSRYLIQASLLILGALSLVSIYYYFHTSNMDGNDLIKQIDFLHPGEFSSKAKSVTEAII
ncbi:MAG: ArnT family glycosyltransferase, partial [Patescibacteria group bacterium]